MHLNKPVVIGIMLVSIAVAGFAAGSFAGAYMLGEPGSEFDPLVAESYLKEAVEEATAELKEEIVALQVEIEILRNKLDGLESRVTGSTGAASRSQSSSGNTGAKNNQQSNTSKPAPAANETPSQPGMPAEPGITGVVNTASGANLRTGPGTDFDRVSTVAHNIRVEITGNMDGWYEVKLADGTKGWIYGPLIDLD
jgi:TolA-binding protein